MDMTWDEYCALCLAARQAAEREARQEKPAEARGTGRARGSHGGGSHRGHR